jgi:hypothetical protein
MQLQVRYLILWYLSNGVYDPKIKTLIHEQYFQEAPEVIFSFQRPQVIHLCITAVIAGRERVAISLELVVA